MFDILLWSLSGFFTGCIFTELINTHIYNLYGTYMSKNYKYMIILLITFFGFLRGHII